MALKVTFDANPLTRNKSGVGYFTHELIQSLADSFSDKVELTGYYFNFGGRHNVSALPSAKNIKYRVVKSLPGKVIGVSQRLGVQFPLNLLVRGSADIVLSTNYVPTLTSRYAKKVVIVYDLVFIDCPEFVQERNLSFLRKWLPPAIRSSDLIICNSNFTKQRLIETYHTAEGKILVLPIPPISPSEPDPSTLTRFKLDKGYLLFVGTIEPRKNIINLVDAYSKLSEELQSAYALVLAGDKGWRDEKILNRISKLQAKGLNIIQTGYVNEEEKASLYQNATLCIQPSHYEGFGMPVLEAMSYGAPVICSDIDVLHEVAGSASIYFDQDDPGKIADVISQCLNSKAKLNELKQAGLTHIKNYPSWKEVSNNLYDSLTEMSGDRS